MKINSKKQKYYYDILNIILDLKRQPVGVRFIFDEEDFVKSNSNSKIGTIPYCTAVRNAMGGECLKLNLNNFACMASAYALGLDRAPNEFISGCRNCSIGAYRDLTISRQISKNMVFCEHKAYGVEIKPLNEFKNIDPNIILLVMNPYSLMRVVQGYSYNNGHLKNLHMGGMNAICQELTSYVHETNSINISLLCSGTRAVSQWDDSELGVGIPYNKMESIIDGILNTLNIMDNNKHKQTILRKLSNIEGSYELDIKLNSNYYRGVYRKPEDVDNI